MRRMLTLGAIFFGSAAVGLVAAGLLVPGVGVGVAGFLVAVAVFTILQSLLTPVVTKLAHKFSPPLVGGVGLISTGLALLIASSVSGGITIATPVAWVLATLLVWLITALGGWLLPMWLLKKKVAARR